MSEYVNPSILPGFMELLPEDQIIFNEMKNIICRAFEKYAFLPIETPLIEKMEILLAKGGGETQKQIFRVDKGGKEMALRFDLTVPLARYVAEHFNKLQFPFRRYHIGKVYRGERNQRGRFREFYQCDIDIVGHESLDIRNDAEIPVVIAEVFRQFHFPNFVFQMNNRKILNGLFDFFGIKDNIFVLRTIDKIYKIGKDNVKMELLDKGISNQAIETIIDFISLQGSNQEMLDQMKNWKIDNPVYITGVDELEKVFQYMKAFGLSEDNIQINPSITRGLDYYTGTVFETFLLGYEDIGSVCSGGRYDDLANNYTKQKLPGVGLSIGLTRLYFQLKEAGLIHLDKHYQIDAVVFPMDGCEHYAIELINWLRGKGKVVQIYFEKAKMKKKFNYADKLHIPYAIIVGEEEEKRNYYSIRTMSDGTQQIMTKQQLLETI